MAKHKRFKSFILSNKELDKLPADISSAVIDSLKATGGIQTLNGLLEIDKIPSEGVEISPSGVKYAVSYIPRFGSKNNDNDNNVPPITGTDDGGYGMTAEKKYSIADQGRRKIAIRKIMAGGREFSIEAVDNGKCRIVPCEVKGERK
jgi:hypothetical protein